MLVSAQQLWQKSCCYQHRWLGHRCIHRRHCQHRSRCHAAPIARAEEGGNPCSTFPWKMKMVVKTPEESGTALAIPMLVRRCRVRCPFEYVPPLTASSVHCCAFFRSLCTMVG